LIEDIVTTVNNFIKIHALPIYFVLVFVISWGAILLSVGFDGIPTTTDQVAVLGMAMLFGPSVAGLLLIGIASGKAGFSGLAERLLRWRVSVRWYAAALVTAPLSTAAVLLGFSVFSSGFLPVLYTSDDRATLLLLGIVGGIMVGLFEELGWTGFAVPRMRLKYGIFPTGLIVGLLWGAWHFLLFWESDTFSGALPLALLLARLFSWLPAYRVLMVWVYGRTESLLVAILMHVSLVATMAIVDPSLTGARLLIFILVRAAVLWIIVAAAGLTQRRAARKSWIRSESLE
jgi:membrane protease YdiL (CAAX protease family)